ncbi:MAG: hypothetical protein ACP5L4_01945 [Thermoplasmata archaeon]
MVGENKSEISEKISEEDEKTLYDLSEFITDMAIGDIENNYDGFFEEIIEHATFQNYEDMIDALIKKVEKKLDEDISYYGFDFETIKKILMNERAFYNYDFDKEKAQEFIERNKDTIEYMYEHDFTFLLREDLENDVLEKLDEWKETIIDKINGLLSNKVDECFYGTLYIYIDEQNIDVELSKQDNLNLENFKLSGKVIGYGMSGIEINFDFRGANITYYGCLSEYGFEYQEDLYF